MKRLLIGAVMIGAIGGQLAAQANLSGGVVVVSAGSAVLVPETFRPWWAVPDPPCDRQAQALRNGERFPYWGYACDPFYAGNNSSGSRAPSMTVTIPQVVATAAPPPAPASPIRPELREYHWPSSGSDSNATTFSIVAKDGETHSATMVWVQDNALCYATPDGSQRRMPIDSIDLEATRQRNAEKQLTLRLPDQV